MCRDILCRAIYLFVYEDNPEVRLQEYTDFWLSSSNVENFDTAALSPSKSALSDAFLSDPLGLTSVVWSFLFCTWGSTGCFLVGYCEKTREIQINNTLSL